MSYALQVHAAIYGHDIAHQDSDSPIRIFYGRKLPEGSDSRLFHVPALYQEDEPNTKQPVFIRHRHAGEDFFLRCGFDTAASRPDWLAEIFLWLSSSYEAGIAAGDSIGRIPYSDTVFVRQGISPQKPHASLLMAWMESMLFNRRETEALPKAPSPVPGLEHLVVCSHDIDFYFVSRTAAATRLLKNLLIAVRPYRSSSYFFDNLKMSFELLIGKRIGDYLPALLGAADLSDFRSTLFVVPRRGHRRDPDYRVEQIVAPLLNAVEKKFSVGVHGSYRSVIEDRSLAAEARELTQKIGKKPLAGRQHWLRFTRHQDLFAEVEAAGLLADSTLGFPDMVGFRNGASFAFPPYDFQREAPHDFLEIPLVLMDGSLEAASRQLKQSPELLANEVLSESRERGWGGIALLWHNPLESISVPVEINRVFWDGANRQKQFCEKWMSVDQFLAAVVHRYQQAGLLPGVRLNQ